MFRTFPLVGLMILFLLTPPIHAEDQKPATEKPKKVEKSEKGKKPAAPTVVNLTLHPAKLPSPPRKYRLTTPYLDQTPGNAASLYYRSAVNRQFIFGLTRDAKNDPKKGLINWDTRRETIEKGLKTPLGDLPRDAINAALRCYRSCFREMEMAARRTECDWGYPVRESESVASILLDQLQANRFVAKALLLRARMEMATGDIQKAIGSLRTVLAWANHMGSAQFMVNKAVEMMTIREMSEQCETLVQLPNAPNFYWTFTTLPQPYINLHNAIDMEEAWAELATPSLREARKRKLSNAEASVFLTRFIAEVRKEFLNNGYLEVKSKAQKEDVTEWLNNVSPGDYVKETYPKALAKLMETGRAKSELEKMPKPQVVLLYIDTVYNELQNNLFQWAYVPYWQSRLGIKSAQREFQATLRKDPLLLAFMATISNPYKFDNSYWPAVTGRRLATLRVIEAIRLFAANHEGRLPKTLDEITEVPIPINPVTGKPFPYELEGDTAVLKADGGPDERITDQREYRIKLAESKK